MLFNRQKIENWMLFGLFICSIIFPKSGPPRNSKTADIPINDQGQFDVNRIRTDLENNGMIVSHRITGHSGMEWPKGESTYINFASGI